MTDTLRPTKKQKELLLFIERFIVERGYSPSYREIMAGLDYNSVATVALHVNSLIKRGQLKKRDRSARSLEVVNSNEQPKLVTNQISPSEERWLVDKVEHYFRQVEQSASPAENQLNELRTLINALKILSLGGAAESFNQRLSNIKKTA